METSILIAAIPVGILASTPQRGGAENAMTTPCACGTPAREPLACQECGGACCAACAVSLESVPYCRSCASALLESSAPRGAGAFILH